MRELGVFAAAGVFIAFFLAFSLLPAILSISAVPKLAYKEPSTVMWNKLVSKMFRFSINRRKWIVGIQCSVDFTFHCWYNQHKKLITIYSKMFLKMTQSERVLCFSKRISQEFDHLNCN